MNRRPQNAFGMAAILFALALSVQATARPRVSAVPWGRRPDPNHPLRKQVQPDSLLRATVALMASGDVTLLAGHVRQALAKAAGKPIRMLKHRKTQLALIEALRREVSDATFSQIVGEQAAGLSIAAQQLDQRSSDVPDRKNMQRGWGFQLLPKNDRAFSDPMYLTLMLRETGQTGNGMVNDDPSSALNLFRNAWSKLAPRNVFAQLFTLTGSDANNALYAIANLAAERRTGQPVGDAELLYFDGIYGGGRGRVGGTSFLSFGKQGAPNLDAYKIESPHSPHFKPRAKAEIERLEAIEARALAQIEDKVMHSAKPVGGLLMESILGPKGVYFYRPEFLLRLRTLCDRLKIPIMADEILTGGGRTGKFFAYQHYPGFEPDFVTFGKGLQVAGVASVSRFTAPDGQRPPHYPMASKMTTLFQYNEPLLKGTQVLNRIRESKLMDNAAKMGRLIVRKLRAYQRAHPDLHRDAEGPVRGMGMLIYSRVKPRSVRSAMNRLMPPLTLNKTDIEQIFSQKELDRMW